MVLERNNKRNQVETMAKNGGNSDSKNHLESFPVQEPFEAFHAQIRTATGRTIYVTPRKAIMDKKRRLCLCEIPVQVWGVFLLTGLDGIDSVLKGVA